MGFIGTLQNMHIVDMSSNVPVLAPAVNALSLAWHHAAFVLRIAKYGENETGTEQAEQDAYLPPVVGAGP
jgi:hypothetical protein